jgi:hypothetical protein
MCERQVFSLLEAYEPPAPWSYVFDPTVLRMC